MPPCTHCGTPVKKDRFFCDYCGSYNLHKEEGNKFCPNCGIRVSPYQTKCHMCYNDLPLEAVVTVM